MTQFWQMRPRQKIQGKVSLRELKGKVFKESRLHPARFFLLGMWM